MERCNVSDYGDVISVFWCIIGIVIMLSFAANFDVNENRQNKKKTRKLRRYLLSRGVLNVL